MLLFRPEHVAPILAGTKTETRRLWKTWRVKVRSIHLAKTNMLSKEHFAKLYIYDRREERLGDIDDEGALREGHPSREAYLAKFAEINKKPLKKTAGRLEDLPVKVILFSVVREVPIL